ncbi:MAG: pyridoxal 5'-phosphate synthase glutaminase subunit PdxT [Clostridiales bacterium]|nr:pyridoxal 5'-phosphate synthase glutaminase subunit PdxT [Clostridiales bacterium]
MKIGVFALQGAFIEHEYALQKLGAETVEIRRREHFSDGLDGIVLPGGESTVQGKLLREEGLFQPVKEAIEGGLPVFGTCAGLILLAKELVNDSTVHFGTMDVTVKRNAYGRQLGSFKDDLNVNGVGVYPAVFIRAPYIESAGKGVEILAETGGHIVAARQKNMLAAAFHPELTDDLRVHAYFLEMIRGK